MGNFIGSDSRDSNFSRQVHPKQADIIKDQRFNQLKDLMLKFEKEYGISDEELIQAIKEPSIHIPLSVYSHKELSALEASVRYLKEELKLKYSQIAKLIDRDERTIWTTYHNAVKKYSRKLDISSIERLPIQVIKDRGYGVLEAITAYLKEERGLKYSQIGTILARDQRTVWTCYSRFTKKRGGKR